MDLSPFRSSAFSGKIIQHMFCSNCGSNVAAGAPFCPACGAAQPVEGAAGAPRIPQTPLTGPTEYVPPQGVRSQTGRWVSAGWELTKADLWVWVVVALVMLVLNSVVPLILQGPLLAGIHIGFARKILYGRTEVGDLFKGFNYFVPTLVASLAISALTFVGMLLCIIPGLVVVAMFLFTHLFIVDKRMDFWPAMQASHSLVKQDYVGFTLFVIVLGLLQVLGALACVVGLLVTLPLMYGAITAAYRDLVGFEPNSIAP